LFNRKNKTLRSVLFTKATFKLLEQNRQTLKSLDGDMDTGEKVKDILERLLSQPRYKDKRARNLDLDDFLQLLADFNQEGIHFTS
jgi:18S rRNA (adenine1779-N6/adenine1780-N6)-dimethyltransferase